MWMAPTTPATIITSTKLAPGAERSPASVLSTELPLVDAHQVGIWPTSAVQKQCIVSNSVAAT